MFIGRFVNLGQCHFAAYNAHISQMLECGGMSLWQRRVMSKKVTSGGCHLNCHLKWTSNAFLGMGWGPVLRIANTRGFLFF